MKTLKRILKWLLAAAMILAGINHFRDANFYLRMMPPVLPAPLFLVYLSGVCEMALGIALLIPKFTRLAAWALMALLLAVFPANIYMWRHAELFPEFGQFALAVRLPLQIVLIAWAYWYTKADKNFTAE